MIIMFPVLFTIILLPSAVKNKKKEDVCTGLFPALPGWLWKRLRTLLSGVLKKAVAMELYSPSAQNNWERRKMIRVTHLEIGEETQRAFGHVVFLLLKLLHATVSTSLHETKGIRTDQWRTANHICHGSEVQSMKYKHDDVSLNCFLVTCHSHLSSKMYTEMLYSSDKTGRTTVRRAYLIWICTFFQYNLLNHAHQTAHFKTEL